MRKNKMMRAASALLVAVLLTTSTISGTFAKYVTTSEAKDEARVAKWGVELQVVGNLYGDSYGADNKIVKDTDGSVSVQSVNYAANTDDVVAPGTKNDEGFIFSLKGKPEVDGAIETTLTVQNIFLAGGEYGVMVPVKAGVVTEANYDEFADLYIIDASGYYVPATGWIDTTYYTLEDHMYIGANYYPVVYTLDNGDAEDATDYKVGTTAINTIEEIATIIATQLGLTTVTPGADASVTYTGTKDFESNTELADFINLDNKVITWAWAFGTPGFEITDNDAADTILGMLENTTDGEVVIKYADGFKAPTEYTHYCLDTRFELEITVAQRD